MNSLFSRLTIFLTVVLSLCTITAYAQRETIKKPQRDTQKKSQKKPQNRYGKRNTPQRASRTDIRVIILTRRGAGLQTQQWSRVFQKLGISLRVRQGLGSDSIGIVEKKIGTLRKVTLTGQLTGRGTLNFSDRSFTQRDSAKLKKWIEELKKFGAQGSPQGKALWGLNKQQFEQVYNAFAKPLVKNVKNLKLKQAITSMNLPEKFNPKFSPAANRMLDSLDSDQLVITKEMKGFSLGTSLAILLKERGLGFLPVRHSDGSIEMAIKPFQKSKKNWPIGWELSRFKFSRQKTAPKLFQLTPVSLQDVPFENTLDAVEAKTGIPIFLDRYTISQVKIDLKNSSVTYQKTRTTWNLLIKAMCTKTKLTSRLKVDEVGKPFVWIAPMNANLRRVSSRFQSGRK